MAEILKSGKDPAYFINQYAKISEPMKGLIPFDLYPFQEDALKIFNDHRFSVVLKARQLGISTTVAGYICWLMLFQREKNVLIVATKLQTATNLVKKVKSIHKHLPSWLKIAEISINNRTSFELSNGSQGKASSTSGDAGRSEALSLLVVDEAAFVEGMDELWAGLYPTLSTGGRCIALSTPNGVGNWFHTKYVNAEAGENDFHPIKLMWDLHPDRDQEWFDKETRNMSRREIAQELECNFNTSGDTVIHPDDIAWLLDHVEEPEYRTGFDRNFWIWEKYIEGEQYLLVGDVARGDGTDSSVFHVLKLSTMEIVAEYQGKPTLDMFAKILYDAGIEYGECLLVVENNGIGISVLEKLINLGYPNLYYSMKSTHEFVEANQGELNNRAIPGFTTSTKTRPLIVAKLEEYIRNKILTLYSNRLFHEMKTFIWKNGKPQAMRSYNDDLVMSLAIACWVRDTAIEVNEKQIEYQKAMLNSMYCNTKKLNTSIKGMNEYNEKTTYKEKLEEKKKKIDPHLWIFKG